MPDVEFGIKYHFDNPILFSILIFSIGIMGYMIGKYDFTKFEITIGFFGWFSLALIILANGVKDA